MSHACLYPRVAGALLIVAFCFGSPVTAADPAFPESARFGDGVTTLGHVSRFHTAGPRSGSHRSLERSEVTALSFTQRLAAGPLLTLGTMAGEHDHASRIGVTAGRLAITGGLGQGEQRPPEGHAFSSIAGNFFHGAIDTRYRTRNLAARVALGARSGFTAGQARVASGGLDDRRAHFLGFDVGGFSATGFGFQRDGSDVGTGLDLALRVNRYIITYSELGIRADASWRRIELERGLGWSGTLGARIEVARNPLYADAEDTRLMLTYRTALGRPPVSARHANSAEETGETEEGLEEAVRRQQRIGLIAGGAVAAAILASSGSSSSDGTKRYGSQNEAAFRALYDINPTSVRENREYGGAVYRNRDGTFSWAGHVRGEVASVSFNPFTLTPGGGTTTATYHTHGGPDPRYINEAFSPQDIRSSRILGLDGYLGTPAGRFLLYEVRTDRIFIFRDADGSEFVLPN